ncbi:hypothetical protein, partial [Flaviflexus sp.]|uniref:hypothetical protein n=1 Tax=Flaviflexus sp. TaxID=1969482 RepID=UPI003F917FB7
GWGSAVRKSLMSAVVAAALVLSACGSVSSDPESDATETQTETTEEPTTSNPTDESTDVSTDDPIVDPTEDETVIPPEEQDPANATAVDGSMSVSLPDDWTYRGELETAYSVFFWTKSDNSQNLSMAPLGPWAQIESPETYIEQLEAAGNLGDATLTYEGELTIDGYDGFWISVEGPGYVANIYYLNVDGGIKEITANALDSEGLAEVDRLVHTIDFH